MTHQFLQHYWWFLIALLGGLLVFLMFVQGGNCQVFNRRLDETRRRTVINSTGRKWELTFTTLVTFGGAFFASFPLFYSTSFGGAYWVWILLLLTFVLQAVSYEFQNKRENLLGYKAFRVFLVINGILAPLIVGTVVGTFFTGSDFTVDKDAVTVIGGPRDRVIGSWGSNWHGLEALLDWHAVSLGLAVVFLTIMLGAMYLLGNINDNTVRSEMRRTVKFAAVPFLLFFLTWLVVLLIRPGYAVGTDGIIFMEKSKYLHNLLQMPPVAGMFLLGVLGVLSGICLTLRSNSRRGIWLAGIGTILVVMGIFFIAGYNGTAYYPSATDLQSSLTITNSSSSKFTLKTMFFVSLLIPFVLAYIVFAWRAMDRRPITPDEIKKTSDKY